MANIPLFGSTGSLFDRIGKVGALLANLRAYQATQLTAMTNTTTGVVAQYDTESDIQAEMGSQYQSLLNSPGNDLGPFCQQMAVDTLNRMVFRAQPQLSQTLSQINLEASLAELIRQMNTQGATVLAMGVTATPAPFIGTGNGSINVTVKRASDGRVQENAFSEQILFLCTSDSYSGTATAGNEGFTVTGAGNQDNLFAFDWPLGSNCQANLTAIAADEDAGGNFLTNSDFEDWTNNIPDQWTLPVGTGGTNVFRNGGIVYQGTYSMQLTGDGSGTQTELLQEFDNGSDGTSSLLSPQNQYSFNFFIRRDGLAPGAGILQVALVDESGNVTQDESGVANSFNVDLTTLSTVFTAYTGTFRTPAIMPETVSLRLKLTTPLTNGRSVYIDSASMGQFTELYSFGPSVAVHAGSIPFQIADYSYMNVQNSRGSGGTLNTWQTVAFLLWGTAAFDLMLPSSSVPTVSDALLGP